jgi:hypothetical protein
MEVQAFVEAALRQSAPGREFTSAVLAGLPALSLSATASSIGAAASKGLTAAKTGSFVIFVAGMLSPVLGALGGILSPIAAVKKARSARERSLLIKSAIMLFCIFIIGLTACFWFRENELLFTRIFAVQFLALVSVSVITGVRVRRLRRRIQTEEGHVHAGADSKLPFGSPESKGFKWNIYTWLLILTFGSPFAMLTVQAAKARDSIALFAILAVLAATFILGRRIFVQKPEQTSNVMRGIMIAQFPLLLIMVQLRWEMWTGQSPWRAQSEVLIGVVVGFLIFAFAVFHWFVKK